MKRDLTPLRDKLRKDARCRRLNKLFQELPLYQVPADDWLSEIERIHKARAIRFLNTSNPRFIESVVDASVRDQADRSRLTEISMQCYKAESTLHEAVDTMRDYLLLTYSSDLAFVRTKEERVKVINLALAPFLRFIERAQRVTNMADLVIKDIDKGSWSLRLLVDSYKLHHAPERT